MRFGSSIVQLVLSNKQTFSVFHQFRELRTKIFPMMTDAAGLTFQKAAKSNAKEIVIETNSGRVKGCLHEGLYGHEYYGFEGVPFAQPPLGTLRFKAPVAVKPWSDVLDCTKKPQKPLQRSYTDEIEGSEDCLYLNIYVKKTPTTKPMPVMVYLFSGGFERGDPTRDSHSPDYFMMKDVIIITVAYRCGVLGFLSLSDPTLNIPGNAGLKDQLLALKWINENIACFQGDDRNITLFGASAGGASVHYMMLSPLAKDLFHKVILMSGVSLCPWALTTVPSLPQRLAKANGYEGENDDKSIFEFLSNLDGSDLMLPNILTKEDNVHDTIFAFGPVIEPYETETTIIAKDPKELLANAWGNALPAMIGASSFEGLLMYGYASTQPHFIESIKEDPRNMLTQELRLKFNEAEQVKRGEKLRTLHFGKEEISTKNILKYCDFMSYKLFWYGIYRVIRARQHHATGTTFVYRFDFDSPTFNTRRIRFCGKDQRGVAHCDDLCYLFYGLSSWKLETNTPEYKTIERLIDIYTSFAEHTNPNCEHTANTHWDPLRHEIEGYEMTCFNISEDLKEIKLPELPKLLAWDEIHKS